MRTCTLRARSWGAKGEGWTGGGWFGLLVLRWNVCWYGEAIRGPGGGPGALFCEDIASSGDCGAASYFARTSWPVWKERWLVRLRTTARRLRVGSAAKSSSETALCFFSQS